MLKHKILITLFSLFLVTDLFGSHYMGGEITWQCLPNGRFRFVMKLYRECNGVTYNASENITVAGCPGLTSINMNLLPGANPADNADGNLDGKTDISPNCWAPGQEINCTPSPSVANTGAIEEWYYSSDAAYPTGIQISGVPPASGWVFSHSSCCRNPSTNVTGATSDSWFLRAVMFPYQGTNTFPCYDNSPVFAEVPATVICTGYPFTYNHNASDKELDSLYYQWAPALDGDLVTPVSYSSGYTFSSPLPSPAQNPMNVGAVVNPFTGEISYTSYTAGAFVTVTKVSAYRCGIKIAEVYREMQIVLLNCLGPVNHKPDVSPPFYNPSTGVYDLYIDTVYAGAVVDFDITAIDMDVLPNGNPNTIYLQTSSQDYGAGYTNPATGCVNPPCATLSPAPPMNAQVALTTHFHWQTDCNHINFDLPCTSFGNVHTFFFKVFDNGCPANAINGVTVSIVVLAPPPMDPPRIHCTEVLPNGDVMLTWDTPPDPYNKFHSYTIYTSSSPTGPFTLLDSLSVYNQTTYTHVGAGANSAPRYYTTRTRSSCYGAFTGPYSDTVASMHLDVTAIGGGQIAQLVWTPVSVPLLGSSSRYYRIYREFPLGSWTFLDSVTNLNYLDTVTVCNDSVNYRIEIADTIGCISVSSIDGATLHDGFPPAMPFMDTVSVNFISGKAEMSWQPSTSPDTRKYYIYRRTGGGPWFIVDSVFGINNTYYMYMASNPQASSESYCVAAVDSCNQTSPMGLEHRTLFLQPINVDVCADKIALKWNTYINMDPVPDGYRILMSENGAPYTVLVDLAPTDSVYDHIGFTENSLYCYYIQAYNSDGETSSSNYRCVLATKPNQPQFVYFRYATVIDNEYAQIAFFVDTTAYILKYKILRSDDGINYNELATISGTGSPSTIVYNDYTAFVNAQSYFYKVVVVDSCNIDALTSNVGRTIFLSGNTNVFMSNYLEWTPYEDRDPQVYNLFRQIDGFDELHRANAVQWGDISYVDDVAMYTETGGRFYYMIEAPLYDIYLSQYPFADTVYSNKILLLQEPRVYIPNAFTPNGLNPIFAPVGVFTDTDEYFMAIYSRWGEKLFETTAVEFGWDGYFEGKVCPLGSYIYIIRFRLPNGDYYEKRGSVTLVR